ncbi:MAG: dihydroorotate dehydrogenase, partial [Syntrophus sp. (in: bacteria)]
MKNRKDHDTQQINLAIEIGSLKLKNPVMTASGTFGYGEEYAPYVDLNRLGAIIVKGLSLKPRHGNPSPRIMETPAGMLNAIGLQNVGVKSFIRDKLPYLRQFDTAIIANVYGETIEEYLRVSEILTAAGGVHALEINVSCPNVKKGGVAFGTDPDMIAEVTAGVKGVTDLPVIVKLSPNVTDIAVMAKAAEAAGADAVSLINTITGMS